MQMRRVCMAQIPLGCDMDVTSSKATSNSLRYATARLFSPVKLIELHAVRSSETDRNRFNQDANVFLGLPKSKEIPRKSGGDVSHSVINNGLTAFKAWVESSATDWIFMVLNHVPKRALHISFLQTHRVVPDTSGIFSEPSHNLPSTHTSTLFQLSATTLGKNLQNTAK